MLRFSTSIYVFGVWVCLAGGLLLDGNSLETRVASLETLIARLTKELAFIQGCSIDFCEIHWTRWSSWTTWSKCTGQCGHGPKEQVRTRARTCASHNPAISGQQCTGDSTETDKRPCNNVEFYGCQSSAHDGSSIFGLAYNFFDELAQSTCTATVKTASNVFALRRRCVIGTQTTDCSHICSNVNSTCFDALHVYTPNILHPDIHMDEGKRGLSVSRYFGNGCSYGTCGPNFCCCHT